MLSTVPVTEEWLHTLYDLLSHIDPYHASGRPNLPNVLTRWQSLKLKKVSGTPDEDRSGYFTGLALVDEFRCLIAALYGSMFDGSKTQLFGATDASDVAARCSYYGNARMKPEEMKAAYDRDYGTFVFAALRNDNLYLDSKCRATMEDMIGRDQAFRYAERCAQIARRRRGFDARPVSDTGVYLLDNIGPEHSTESRTVAGVEAQLTTLQQYQRQQFNGLVNILVLLAIGLLIVLYKLW
jgi:hypothetical protein